jgi:hypothetical protein
LLNFQSARNAMKMVPLCLSRLPDSGGIFTFSNGVRMEKLSRSVRQGKQAKFLDADCTCHTVRTVTWQGRTIRTVMWQVDDVACFHWLMLTNQVLTRVLYLANGVRTRGPIWRRHVSLIFGSYGSCIKSNGSPRGSTPGPPSTMQSSNKDRPTNPPTLCFLPYNLLQCI